MQCTRLGFRHLKLSHSPCAIGSNIRAFAATAHNDFFPTRIASAPPSAKEIENRIAAIPIERFRNFCIVAHVDHGKSTLSDRLLELTGTIEKGGAAQILDRLEVERERGITVKAQTSAMIYKHSDGKDYLLHLVDTPGHVDFRTEVSRTYSSCGGALLVVDASQGVQAQTVANFFLAFSQGLSLVPILNKVDLPTSDIERTKEQIFNTFEIDASDAVCVSAKSGLNVEAVLPTVIEHIPSPVGQRDAPLRLLLVDSWYDDFRGVVLLVRVFDGELRPGDTIASYNSGKKFIVGEVGILLGITRVPQGSLRAGQVGYVFFNPGMKRMQDALPGDTFSHVSTITKIEPLPGFEEPRSVVFVSAFPVDPRDFEKLRLSLEELALNDRSINISKESSVALGAGFRLGFLGTLHCSVFEDRLRQEHGQSIILTPPSTLFKVVKSDGSEQIFSSPEDFPESNQSSRDIRELQEPYVAITITVSEEYLGRVIELCEANRGEQVEIAFFSQQQMVIKYNLPLSNLVDDFFGKLKGCTKGYGNLEYEDAGFRKSSLQKLQLLVNKEPVDALSRIVHTSDASRLGRQWVTKFKPHVERQYFQVIIQAVAGNKVLARESIAPYRKDVTAKLHAADKGRRQKLLENQKAGRKRLSMIGSVEIKQEAFQSFLSK